MPERIAARHENDYRKRVTSEILLEREALIGGHENLEADIGRSLQQLAVPESRPTLLLDRPHVVAGERSPQPPRQLLVKQDAHWPSAPRERLQVRPWPARE